ncbi:oxysterol-binding protein-related protein 1C-like protein isoform X1 [Tanacetum coccineum]
MMNLKGYEKGEIIHSLAWQRTAFAAMAGDDDTIAFLHLCFCYYNELLGRDGHKPKAAKLSKTLIAALSIGGVRKNFFLDLLKETLEDAQRLYLYPLVAFQVLCCWKFNLNSDDGEAYQWSKVTTSIHNLILGKLYCDHYGMMRVQGNQTILNANNIALSLIWNITLILDSSVVEDKSGTNGMRACIL